MQFRTKAIGVLSAVAIGYVVLSEPKKLIVTRTGEITGGVNMAREALQGHGFWKQQRGLADRELARQRTQPLRDAEDERAFKKLVADTHRMTEELYRERPELRPSSAKVKAEALRDKADRVELQELNGDVEIGRQRRIEELEEVIALIDARLALR